MKFLLKTLLNLLILLFILVICLLGLAIWSVPKLAPKAIDYWMESKTGFSTSINSVDLKLFSGSLNVEGIALLNPPYYQNKNFMQIKQIAVHLQPTSVYKDGIVFDSVFVDIERLTWVKNAQNSINVVEFLDKLRKKAGPSIAVAGVATSGTLVNKKPSDDDYLIKNLIVKVNAVDIVGFPSENDIQSFPVNYSKEFANVADIEDVMNQVIADFSAQGVLNLAQDLLNSTALPEALGEKVTIELQKGVEKAFQIGRAHV